MQMFALAAAALLLVALGGPTAAQPEQWQRTVHRQRGEG